jgi:YfiH family protein
MSAVRKVALALGTAGAASASSTASAASAASTAGAVPLAAHAALIPVPVGMRAGISLASAGNMDFTRRDELPWRNRFLAGEGIDPSRAFGVRQVHSRRVVVVDGASPAKLAALEADGMITAQTDTVLTVTVADCLPIFLVDPVSGAFGLLHSGWKGTGILTEAIRAMSEEFGTRAADVSMTIGPGIGPCCYTVPEDRASGFAEAFGAGAVVRPGPEAHSLPRLDLRAANIELARLAGVREIVVVDACTSCTAELGSSRRQGQESFTRMLAFICRATGA